MLKYDYIIDYMCNEIWKPTINCDHETLLHLMIAHITDARYEGVGTFIAHDKESNRFVI